VQTRDAGKLSAATVSGIEMIETIKASGAENGYFEKWSGYHASVNTQSVKFIRLNQYLGAVPGLVSSLVNTSPRHKFARKVSHNKLYSVDSVFISCRNILCKVLYNSKGYATGGSGKQIIGRAFKLRLYGKLCG